MKPLKFIAVMMIAVFASCSSEPDAQSSSAPGERTAFVPTVEVTHPQKRSFKSDQTITASLFPDQSIYVHAMENGQLKSIFVDVGDRINKGQRIAKLYNPNLQFEYRKAELALKEAEGNYQSSLKIFKLKQDALQSQKSMFDRLDRSLKESKGLTTINEVEKARNQYELAKAEIAMIQAQTDHYLVEIDMAKSQISATGERLNMLDIRAPFTGVVTGRFADPGSMIQNALDNQNAMAIVSIEKNDVLRLRLPIPESDVAGINVGDEVRVEMLTSGKTLKAPVSRIAQSLDPASKTMDVQIDIHNKDGLFKSGMYAKAYLERSTKNEVLSLPHSCILMKRDQAVIFTVNGEKVEEIPLKKGLSGLEFFEVLNDKITEETRVITKGKSSVKKGQEVKAILK